MAINWKNGVSGSFTDPTAWDSGHVPASGDDAVVGVAGSYTVSLSVSLTVNSLTISDSNATLSMVAPGVTDTVTNGVSNGGDVDLEHGASFSTAASFTNSGTLDIDDRNNGSQNSGLTVGGDLTNTSTGLIRIAFNNGNTGNSTVTVTGTLNNAGTLDVGNNNLAGPVTITAGTLIDTGSIYMDGGNGKLVSLTANSAAPGTLTGSITLVGDALLQYGSGAISALSSTGFLSLQGTQAKITVAGQSGNTSALNGFTSNAGYFDLEYGASYNTGTGVSFTNSGTLDIDDRNNGSQGSGLTVGGDLTNTSTGLIRIAHDPYQPGTSTLAVTGTLNNSGTLDAGTTSLAGPVSITAGTLVDTGTIDLTGANGNQTSLIAGSAAPDALAGSITLAGDALLQYGSGAITAISSTGSLSLQGTQAQIS